MHKEALFVDSGGISAKDEAPDVAIFDDSIAEGSMEEAAKQVKRSEPARRESAADGRLAVSRNRLNL